MNKIRSYIKTSLELEQEIDAIAPSVERGEWEYSDTGLATNAGTYSMNTDTLDAGLGDPANIFAAVENIVINEKDKAGTIHSFANVEVGQLLEVFEAADSDYGLYEILDVTEQTGGGTGPIPAYTYWSFDVALVRTGQGDTASGLARFKIFSPPEGGTADGFVMKSGDNMTGGLIFAAYKPEENGNPAANVMSGVTVWSRNGSAKILNVSTGSKYTQEECSTALVPKTQFDITNKGYVDGLWDFSQYPELT